jgi:Family of unknown function (DUF5519)
VICYDLLDDRSASPVAESNGRLQASKKSADGVWIMKHLKKLEEEVSAWPQVSVRPHRFGGKEFRFGSAEIGHVHVGGVVDIPFPRSIRDALLAEGLAEEHHWVPDSGWITFRVRSEDDLKHSVWLMRLSYVRYALKTANDPRGLLEQESEELHLSAKFRSLLEPFVPNTANHAPAEPLSA